MQWSEGSRTAHESLGIQKKSPRRQARSHKVQVRPRCRMISNACSSRAPSARQQHWRDLDRQKGRPRTTQAPVIVLSRRG